MFNPNSNDLLELKPIPEPADIPPDTPEEMEEEPVQLTQNEIFKSAEKPPTHQSVKMEVEEGVMTKREVNGWGKEIKRGVGKRGKDKKKRVKKPPTQKQLAHLARMRDLAKQKRAANKLEKKRKEEEAKRIQKELEELKPTVQNTKIIKNAVLNKPEKKVHFHSNTPRQPTAEEQQHQFFELMEKYELYKEAKNYKIKQREKSIQERLNEKRRQNKPHPNRRIPQIQRPQPPPNPYDDIFNYKGFS